MFPQTDGCDLLPEPGAGTAVHGAGGQPDADL